MITNWELFFPRKFLEDDKNKCVWLKKPSKIGFPVVFGIKLLPKKDLVKGSCLSIYSICI